MLPDGWKLRKLKELSQHIGRGQSPKYSEDPSDIFAVNQKCVRIGGMDLAHIRPHDPASKIKKEAILHFGDICLNSTGTGTLGRVALWNVRGTQAQYFADTHITVVRCASNEASSEYVKYYLESSFGQKAIELECITGSTNQIELSKSALSDIGIPTPPLPEQKRIAEVLGTVDAAIEATKAVIDQTKTVKQGLLQTLLTRGIGHTKFKDSPLGEIPETWEVKTLGVLSDFITSGSRGWAQYYAERGALFVRITNLKRESVRVNLDDRVFVQLPENASEGTRTRLQTGDVLISITADLGITAHIDDINDIGEAYINQHIALVRPRKADINPLFLANYIASDFGQSQLGLMNDSGTKAGLNLGSISRLNILCPPMDEQVEIGKAIAELDDTVGAEKAKLAKLHTLKKGLMNDLLTGKVRVNVVSALETQASNVVPFALTAPIDAIRKHALLSAEITAQLYHLNTFGATKREKLTDLVVRHVGLDETTDRQATRHAAGSYDPKARREIDDIFERENWFKIQRSASAVKFVKGTAFGGHKAEFDEQFGSVKLQIQKVINLLRDYDTRQCEIIDTLYTAWNDFLIDGKSPSDDDIITEVLTNWHDSKLNISRQDWRSGLSWMRERDFVPVGRGRSTKAPSLL